MNAFDGFVERKTAEAEAAAIERFKTEIDRGERLLPVGNDWSRRMFDGPFYMSAAPDGSLPACSLVFVQSRDRNTAAEDPAALGGGEADTHLVYEGLSRVAADAVLAGAGTVRTGAVVLSVWKPQLVDLRASLGLPRHPAQIVASIGGLDLSRGLMFNTPVLRVIVITVPSGAEAMRSALEARPWISVITMERAGELRWAFSRLRERGIHRLSCIGGRTLAEGLIDAGLVQDLYLTTSPKPGGHPGTPFYSKPLDGELIVRKHGTGADAGVIFEHIVLPVRTGR
ncbi:MAG TPA: dihydrofolate reductase family protein [Vicinamibacterales bacterium]|nr:dihydrofolate reductase family protein [Vicinamibacterales bacterium]